MWCLNQVFDLFVRLTHAVKMYIYATRYNSFVLIRTQIKTQLIIIGGLQQIYMKITSISDGKNV